MKHYDAPRKATLLQRCHRLFLDCVDFGSGELEGVMRAFDFFSQIYCQKFEVGQLEDQKAEEHDRLKNLGVYKMISDIHDASYKTPLTVLKGYKQQQSSEQRTAEMNEVLWWVFFAISCILVVMYCIGLYFTYFDDPKEFHKTFNNDRRLKYGGMSKEDLQDAQKINRQIKDNFQAPTESQLFKDAKARKTKRPGTEKHLD